MRQATTKRLGRTLKTIAPAPGRWPKRDPTTAPMFDQHPVSDDDIRAWLRAVPKLDPDSPRAAHYVASYDVTGKIEAAKAAGTFWRLVGAA